MASDPTDQKQAGVRRRRVFYIPGYDPIHPRRYRELYRKESAEQAKVSDYRVEIKPKKETTPYGWHVDAVIEDRQVRADVEVLVWSDLVRESMSTSIPATYLQMARTAWVYIGSGTLRRLMMLRKGPVIAAFYPVAMLLAQLFLALLMGWVAARLVVRLRDLIPLSWSVITWVFAAIAVAAGVAMAVSILRWFRARDGKLFAYYLMHDYVYSSMHRGANPDALESRMAEFGAQIAEALQSDVDEVLVVAHSSGVQLAISVVADLIRAGRVPPDGPALGFLSLGQVVPMVSFLPEARRLRGDLRYLSARDELIWVDVSAPGDGCAFALCDPVTVSGVAPPDKVWPLVLSAAFTQTLSPARWKQLRWRFFRLHFQYLCAFDQPGDYDYFQITAGPMTLRDRYSGRAASRSRIDVPVSKYTSVRAA